MGEQKRRRPRKNDRRRREAPRFERVRVDAPPGLSAELTFPWVSILAIGSAPVPSLTRSRHAAPPRRRKPAE
jgi:hypothetical protein